MNWNRIEGNWSELKGQARRNWGKLTEDHIDHVNGKREHLASKIKEVYGIDQEEAERQINEFTRSMPEVLRNNPYKK